MGDLLEENSQTVRTSVAKAWSKQGVLIDLLLLHLITPSPHECTGWVSKAIPQKQAVSYKEPQEECINTTKRQPSFICNAAVKLKRTLRWECGNFEDVLQKKNTDTDRVEGR